MTDGKRSPPGGQRRRRRPTVINLEATEVEAGPVAPEPRTDTPAEQQQQQEPAPVAAEPPPSQPPSPEPQMPEPPLPEPPSRPPRGSASPGGRMFAWLPEELTWAQASAGIAGAAGGLLVFLLLWLVGAFSGTHEPAIDVSPRLAAIEKQLHDLAARPTATGVDAKAIAPLAARLSELERVQSAPRAPVTDPVVLGRLSAAERALKSVADNVAGLSRRADGIDAALRTTQGRLDKISAALSELQTTARAAAAGSDRAARLAVAAATLRATVERGAPFAAELTVVKALTSDAGALAPLEPFAASGLPSDDALGKELVAIVQPMLRAGSGEASPNGGSFLGRLQANAEKLVRIRPIDQARGDDRSTALARIAQKAAQADVAGALAELAKLPASERAPMQGWIAKAQARNHAVEAGRRFAAAAIAALNATP